jgi:hypothetical protein
MFPAETPLISVYTLYSILHSIHTKGDLALLFTVHSTLHTDFFKPQFCIVLRDIVTSARQNLTPQHEPFVCSRTHLVLLSLAGPSQAPPLVILCTASLFYHTSQKFTPSCKAQQGSPSQTVVHRARSEAALTNNPAGIPPVASCPSCPLHTSDCACACRPRTA